MTSGRTGHWTKMHQSLVKFSESEASNHAPSLADFTTTTPELKFSVLTAPTIRARWPRSLCSQSARLSYLGSPRLSSSEFDPTETSSPQPPLCSFLNQRLLPPRGC